MTSTSLWRSLGEASTWPTLEVSLQADVVVVGAGITGVTLATVLAEAGKSVVVLEARHIGAGHTGGSTGNLYQTVGAGMRELRRKWGAEVAQQVARSRGEAIGFIEQRARSIAASAFRRCTMYLTSDSPSTHERLEDECKACEAAGLRPRWDSALPAGLLSTRFPVLALDHQAQFDPMAYVQGLAHQAARAGARLFENSPVIEIDGAAGLVSTARGTVQAAHIVLATHSPSGSHLVQAGMLARREYALAFPLAAEGLPPGIFWCEGQERLSVRGHDGAHGKYVVCVGQHHPSGHHDATQALAALQALVQRRLGLSTPVYRWSAQHFHSADGLPYIGRDVSGMYIATGFDADGLVYGTLAASIIACELLGRDNEWARLYKASRLNPMRSAHGVAQESVNVVRTFLQERLTPRQHAQVSSVAPGEAQIMDVYGQTLAAYRSPRGQLHVVAPVCTHMKCTVQWNAVETSWDCPCHGSRFAPDGQVISGPALVPLRRLVPPDSHS